MQRLCYLRPHQRGFAVLSVIFLVVFLFILTQGILHIVCQQAKSQQEYIRQRQIVVLGIDLMLQALQTKEPVKLSSKRLPTILLYPGAESVVPQIQVENCATLPLRAVNVEIKSKNVAWQMQHLQLEPPGGTNHEIYNNIIYSGQEIIGNIPKDLLPANYPLTNIVPTIDTKGYLKYKSMPLPDACALREVGLLSRIYANDNGVSSGLYIIGNNTIIKGNGVLYSGNPINLQKNCHSSGKLWLICNDKIIIGDNVKLEHAFLFAKGPIYIGRNVSICGIIVSAGRIELGDGFSMQGDKSVLEKFSTSCYMN
ncbi:MAG: hypothetical protein PHR07_00545 [Acidaminococcaceae bacterium]|nr:hypothetical protein [Acidaminococcaceae bacterium]